MKRRTYERAMNVVAFGGVAFLLAVAAMTGKKARASSADTRDTDTVVKYNDVIVAFDAKYQPRVDSLHNKIRSAMSNDEIDYADFRELMKIDSMRSVLLKQKAIEDFAEIQR